LEALIRKYMSATDMCSLRSTSLWANILIFRYGYVALFRHGPRPLVPGLSIDFKRAWLLRIIDTPHIPECCELHALLTLVEEGQDLPPRMLLAMSDRKRSQSIVGKLLAVTGLSIIRTQDISLQDKYSNLNKFALSCAT
jgi:hypothetical protein